MAKAKSNTWAGLGSKIAKKPKVYKTGTAGTTVAKKNRGWNPFS